MKYDCWVRVIEKINYNHHLMTSASIMTSKALIISAKKYSTPRSGRRKRRAISPAAAEQPPSSSKAKKVKRNLDFSEKGQEVATHSENVLNIPYSHSKEELEVGADLAL